MGFIDNLMKIWSGSAQCGDIGILLPFSLVSGIIGTLTFYVDGLSTCLLKRKSVYKFSHGFRTIYFSPLWFFACVITAGLGFSIKIYEPTLLAAFLSAVFWFSFLKMALPSFEDKDPY